jgi:hypothetical protein
VLIAPADVLLGNVVAPAPDAGAHALQVQLDAGKARVPHMDPEAPLRRFEQKAGHRPAAQRGLECKIELLGIMPILACAKGPGS